MNDAAKSLKKAHASMNGDDGHEMMDDIAEQQDVAKEISEAISNPVAFGQEFDEDDLEAELEELEKEGELEEQRKLDEEFLDVGPSTSDLPEVPSAVPERKEAAKKKQQLTDEEKELAELAAFAS